MSLLRKKKKRKRTAFPSLIVVHVVEEFGCFHFLRAWWEMFLSPPSGTPYCCVLWFSLQTIFISYHENIIL